MLGCSSGEFACARLFPRISAGAECSLPLRALGAVGEHLIRDRAVAERESVVRASRSEAGLRAVRISWFGIARIRGTNWNHTVGTTANRAPRFVKVRAMSSARDSDR